MEKEKAKLGFRDYVEIVREKPAFTIVFSVCVMLFLLLLFGVLTDGRFLSASTLLIVFNQGLIIATAAIGVSFIYTTGNIDISVGNILGLSAVFGALAYNDTQNAPLMIIVSVISGMILMFLNSMLSVLLGIKTITVAVVMIQLYGAITNWILGPEQIRVNYSVAKGLENNGYRYVAFILYFVVCLVIYHKTVVGRRLRFIGGNEVCARQTGMNSKSAVIIGFIIAGVGIGLGATFSIIRTGTVSVSTGDGMGMNIMLATVLGGMSIFGGSKSNCYSGVFGAMTVAILNSGIIMVGVSTAVIQGIRGVVFLLLVFLNSERPDTLPSKQQV